MRSYIIPNLKMRRGKGYIVIRPVAVFDRVSG